MALDPPLPPSDLPVSTGPLNASGAQVSWSVSFVDPGATWSSYYSGITAMIQAAGREWARLFDSSASIEVAVSFSTTILTATGRSLATAYVDTDPINNINLYEQGAAAEINTGLDANGATSDVEIVIGVNPSSNYLTTKLWFDSDGAARTAPIPAGRVDALSVFIHELGHAIGYNGWADWTTGQVPSNYASTFDDYIINDAGHNYFTGTYAVEVYGADAALTDGNIYHWGNASGPGVDLVDQVMNGISFGYQTRYDISSLDVAVMNDIGMVIETNPPFSTTRSFNYQTGPALSLTFDESLRTGLQVSDLTLTRIGPGGVTTVPSASLGLAYARATNTASISLPASFSSGSADGNYLLTLSSATINDLAGNVMSADQTLRFFVLAADANRDRIVDTQDFNLLAANFGGAGNVFSQGNFDYDTAGQVDSVDFGILVAQYGQKLPAASALSGVVVAPIIGAPAAGLFDAMGSQSSDDESFEF